uniref:Uncharacterized protein n=1 Tax=Rhizophora mucronata TaxID=61149 RepID=A0A2P2PWS6_RHIMU
MMLPIVSNNCRICNTTWPNQLVLFKYAMLWLCYELIYNASRYSKGFLFSAV